MDFAIIETGGKQYRVVPGEELELEKLGTEKGIKVSFDKVLLVKNGEKIEIGRPYLKDKVIEAEVIDQKKGKKIRVARFRAKSRYRKVFGHRQRITQVKIGKKAK